MKLLDTDTVDIISEKGSVALEVMVLGAPIKVEVPIVWILAILAQKTDNKLDDALVELVAKALDAEVPVLPAPALAE